MATMPNRDEQLPLGDVLHHLLVESRMVLPGMQTLFGFQLAVVFHERFLQMGHGLQLLHLLAVSLVGIGICLVMSPASYHRQVAPELASHKLVLVASRMLLTSMVPLSIALSLEFYLVVVTVIDKPILAGALALLLLAVFATLWFFLPRRRRFL